MLPFSDAPKNFTIKQSLCACMTCAHTHHTILMCRDIHAFMISESSGAYLGLLANMLRDFCATITGSIGLNRHRMIDLSA